MSIPTPDLVAYPTDGSTDVVRHKSDSPYATQQAACDYTTDTSRSLHQPYALSTSTVILRLESSTTAYYLPIPSGISNTSYIQLQHTSERHSSPYDIIRSYSIPILQGVHGSRLPHFTFHGARRDDDRHTHRFTSDHSIPFYSMTLDTQIPFRFCLLVAGLGTFFLLDFRIYGGRDGVERAERKEREGKVLMERNG